MTTATKRTFKVAITVVVIAAIAGLAYEVTHWLTHVYASGARVQTELTRMAARVDGTIKKVEVREGDRVKTGQLLVSLLDDDIRLQIEVLRGDLKLEGAARERLKAERTAFENELASKVATKRASVRAVEVELGSAKQRLVLARKDMARVKTLFAKELTAERELAIEQDKVLVMRGQHVRLLASLAVARRELEQVESAGSRLAVYDERIKLTVINQSKIETQIEGAQVALSYRHVRSPLDGIVDRVYKFKGEYVDEGDLILIVHDERLSWVEAYVDEDQIRHMRVGQSVDIDFEAYPFEEYAGTVLGIGSVTTKQMGLVTQRASQFGHQLEQVPVRISIDERPPNLAPGMVANINVRIYD